MRDNQNDKWYCKYCNKTVSIKRKNDHRLIRSHRIKARWYKYFREIDEAIKIIKDNYDQGFCSIAEFNEMEQEIYDKVDKADVDDYFWNMSDSE